MKQLTMTKVLTPLAALAFAFGVQAATVGLQSSDGFESYTADTAMVTNQNGWVFSYGSDGADDASTIAEYGVAAKPASLPDAFAAAGNNYLKLSTEDGTLFRNMDGANGDTVSLAGGLYVDTDVQFTVTDSTDRPEVIGGENGDKFIIWLEADTTAHTTNLCAWARHYYAAGSNSNAVFNLVYANDSVPDVQPGAWHRLTVKAIANVNQGEATTIPAFQVYLDGQVLKTTEFAVNTEAYTLTQAATTLANAGTILPAMADTMESLSKVGFSGEGALDNVAVTRAVPAFSANSAQVAFNFAGSTVTGVGISALNLSVDNSGDCVSVETGASFQIQLEGYNQNTHNITITPSGNISFDSATMTVTVLGSGAASLAFATTAKDSVNVTLDWQALIGVLDDASAMTDLVSIAYTVGADTTTLTYADILELIGNEQTSVVLENLKVGTNVTVTVTYAANTDWATRVSAGSANVTVSSNVAHIDSFGEGTATIALSAFAPAAKIGDKAYESIQAAVNDVTTSAQTTIKLSGDADLETPVSVAAGQNIVIDLNGKTITGAENVAVFTNAGTLTITDTNDGTKGSVVAGTNGYVVSDTGTLNLVYGTYEGAFDGTIDSLTADCLFDNNLSGVYTPATGYEMAEVEGNMYQLKAQSYSITYKYGESTLDLTPASYTYNVATALPVSASEVTGKTFAGWYDNSGLTGDPVTTIAAGTTGAQTFYAKYTNNTYTIKFVYGANGESTNEVTNVAHGTIPTAPSSATVAVAGKNFTGWDKEVVAAVADATYVAQYEDAAQPIKPSEGGASYSTPEAATEAAATINGNKAEYIQPPAGATAPSYYTFFDVKAVGTSVVFELNEAGTNALETVSTNAAATVAANLSTVAAAGNGNNTTVGVAAQPGFYYSVEAGSALGSLVEGTRVLATGSSVNLTVPNKGASGFYRIKVSVKSSGD